MPNKCFVPGCKTGYASYNKKLKVENKKPPILFRAPKDNQSLEVWNKHIPRDDKLLSEKDYVCELHFEATSIIKYDEFNITEGVVEKLERTTPMLKTDAVPTIFPGLPKYLTTTIKKRPAPKLRLINPIKKEKIDENIVLDYEEKSETEYNIRILHQEASTIPLPGTMWGIHTSPGKTILAHLNLKLECDKTIVFTDNCIPIVHISKKLVEFPEIKCNLDLQKLVRTIDELIPCTGYTENGFLSSECIGYVKQDLSLAKNSKRKIRCINCSELRRKNQRKYKKKPRVKVIASKLKIKSDLHRKLCRKVLSLKQQLNLILKKYDDLTQTQLSSYTEKLPEKQKEAINACFNAANCKSSNGRRYTTTWVYECLLMRIKSPKLYRKMRRDNILPLPSYTTLQRYIKKLRPVYGFSDATIKMMGLKVKEMTEMEKHGCLLIDEMKLSEALSFKKSSLQVEGFVDLGEYSTEKDQDKLGDHALVILFQPFCGKWFQPIGAFLGAGAVPGTTLEKIIMEAVIMLENQGIHVDCVTTDGATWNRSMWKLFGIGQKSSSCIHPSDSKRQLWFASDFPHLIKNLKSRIINNKVLDTPEGTVDVSHWKSIIKADSSLQIKICHKLTADHIRPKHFQTMNVKMAFQFFSRSVAAAMEYYKDKVPELNNCEASIAFVKRIDQVVDAMNSQIPKDALRPDPESIHNKVLSDFLIYLDELDNMNTTSQRKLTSSTALGLRVTIKTALELVKYLSDNFQFKYLLTRRINQDTLEHFFGSVRDACGSSCHPDSILFIQVFRLLSTYALVRPPRGSNVSGGELLETITTMKDVIGDENYNKKIDFENKIDDILDNVHEIPVDNLISIADHDYTALQINEDALTVLSGYVARKMRRVKPAKCCQECYTMLCAPDNHEVQDREKLLELKTRGYLLVPSKKLYEIIYQLEDAICSIIARTKIQKNLLFLILDELRTEKFNINLLGCDEHANALTKNIITFYLQSRMYFVCDAENANREKNKRQKNLAKQSKLI